MTSVNFGEKKRKFDIAMWSNRLTPKTYNPPPHGDCKTINIIDISNIGLVIGKNGFVFNAITHQTPNVNYIWYNKSSKCIEIWGDTIKDIEIACDKINTRIHEVDKMINKKV